MNELLPYIAWLALFILGIIFMFLILGPSFIENQKAINEWEDDINERIKKLDTP